MVSDLLDAEAPVSNSDGIEQFKRPADQTSWRYVLRFLLAGLFITLSLTVGLAGYNVFRTSDLEEANEALDKGGDGMLHEAYALLSSPHVFGGWHVAEQVIPQDPELADIREDELFQAAMALPPDAAPFEGLSRLATCESDYSCIWRELVRGQTTLGRVQLWYYLRFRRALALGQNLDLDMQTFFVQYPSLYVRAIREQMALGRCTFGSPTPMPLLALRDGLAQSISNSWVFVSFGGIVSFMFLLTCLGWSQVPWRRRTPETT